MAGEIKNKGLVPGIWLAPFIAHPEARILKDHPNWVLRNRWGMPVNAGFIWNAFTTGLDLTHPSALEYTRKVIETAVHDWGFPYLKLDFLYAGALKGKHYDPTKTRAQILYSAIKALRDSAGKDTFLLGCGAPLGSAVGLVDAMRIGADVSGSWEPEYFGVRFPFRNEPCMPSARNSIQNILTRSILHKNWWINDPDCVLVREATKLSLPELQSLITVIGLTGGSLMISDDLPNLSPDRHKLIEMLIPVIEGNVRILDWFDKTMPEKERLDLDGPEGNWHLIAKYNWSENPVETRIFPEEFQLEGDSYLVRSHWEDQVYLNASEQALWQGLIEAHGVVLLAVRKNKPSLVQYAGDNFHLSQGKGIKKWVQSGSNLLVQINLGRLISGEMVLKTPCEPLYIRDGGTRFSWRKVGETLYAVKLFGQKMYDLDIGW